MPDASIVLSSASGGTDLFIFFLGLASVIVLITGQRNRRKKKKQAKNELNDTYI